MRFCPRFLNETPGTSWHLGCEREKRGHTMSHQTHHLQYRKLGASSVQPRCYARLYRWAFDGIDAVADVARDIEIRSGAATLAVTALELACSGTFRGALLRQGGGHELASDLDLRRTETLQERCR